MARSYTLSPKSAFRSHPYHSPRKICVHDELCAAELAEIAMAKAMHVKIEANGSGHAVRVCECAETLIRGRRIPCPAGHNCAYTAARSALVPEAESLATRIAGGREANAEQWVFYFTCAMEELVRQHGLLNGSNGSVEASTIDDASQHDNGGQSV